MTSRLNRLAFENRFDMSHTAHYACNVTKYLELIATHSVRSAHKLLLQQILVHQISGYTLLTERFILLLLIGTEMLSGLPSITFSYITNNYQNYMPDRSSLRVYRILSNNMFEREHFVAETAIEKRVFNPSITSSKTFCILNQTVKCR